MSKLPVFKDEIGTTCAKYVTGCERSSVHPNAPDVEFPDMW